MDFKIGLVGGGQIGGALAFLIGQRQIADVILFDIDQDLAKGKELDLNQAMCAASSEIKHKRADSFEELKDANVLIITAGVARKPGLTRDDLLKINREIIVETAKKVRTHCKDAFVIVVTNPVDIMTYTFIKESGLPKTHVVGMGGVLDTARFCFFLSERLGVSHKDIKSLVIGAHGDTMLPLLRYTTVGGIPFDEVKEKHNLSSDECEQIIERTKQAGGEIVKYFKNGSAFYAPAAGALKMAESYLFDQKRIIPCSVLLDNQYGLNDICFGVPIMIGSQGVEKIIKLSLNEEERKAFLSSAETVKKNLSG
ncbi:MAG: malate dehydrogenase [Alphaproteobacteria bacterium]